MLNKILSLAVAGSALALVGCAGGTSTPAGSQDSNTVYQAALKAGEAVVGNAQVAVTGSRADIMISGKGVANTAYTAAIYRSGSCDVSAEANLEEVMMTVEGVSTEVGAINFTTPADVTPGADLSGAVVVLSENNKAVACGVLARGQDQKQGQGQKQDQQQGQKQDQQQGQKQDQQQGEQKQEQKQEDKQEQKQDQAPKQEQKQDQAPKQEQKQEQGQKQEQKQEQKQDQAPKQEGKQDQAPKQEGKQQQQKP